MILKPFSTLMKTSYRDFINQNYFISLPDHGLRKINLKGVNKITKENDPGFNEIDENEIILRKYEDLGLSPELIAERDKPFIAEISKKRLEQADQNSQVEISFFNLGAVFSFEMIDIVWLNEMKSKEMQNALDIIKDSLNFSEKGELYEKFTIITQNYFKYLENPSDSNTLNEVKTGLELCIKNYPENPFAHIMLGFISLRPTSNFDLNRSQEEFLQAKEYSIEIENHCLIGLCNFVLAWISYLNSETDKAIELSLESIDNEFMNIPEAYFNLAKFYASKKDTENALRYLNEVISQFDFLYSVKADIDEDFSLIKPELVNYFVKLRDEERSKIMNRLNEMGITITGKNDKKKTETENKENSNETNEQQENTTSE